MVPAAEIVQRVGEMLTSPALNLADILPDATGWADAVEQLVAAGHETRYTPPLGRTRNDYIRRRLGHIAANPHSEDNSQALTETYVCAADANPDNGSIDDDYINKSPKHMADFVADLVYRAREARRLLLEKDAIDAADRARVWAPELHVIVHGERGCGKTFLLNHILCKFSADFDRERVLWVRVNLTQEFGTDLSKDFRYNLLHHIHAQLTKIVLRYYEPSSEFYRRAPKPYPLPVMEELQDFVRSRAPDKETRARWTDALIDMANAFGKRDQDPPVNPDLVPQVLAREAFHLALGHGYCVVCVLDGLDQLENSAYQRRRFEQLFDAAQGLASSLGNAGLALASVTRTNTLNTLPDLARKPSAYVTQDRTIKKVYPVDIDAIVGTRVRFLRDHVRTVAAQERWLLDDWPEHLDDFVAFLSASEDDRSAGVSLQMFGDNRRAQVQVVQLRYYDFLEREKLPRYLFVESLVLSGRRFPPKPYRLSMTRGGGWRPEFLGGTWYDHHLLPSVFSFPYVDWDPNAAQSVPVPQRHGPLWGIRLLQVINASERLHDTPGSWVDYMTVGECSQILNVLFSYPPDLTGELINRFKEFGLLGLEGRDFPHHRSTDRLQLRLKPKAHYVLRRFLYDIAYLHLCAMRLPLKGHQNHRTSYFIPAGLGVLVDPEPSYTWELGVSQTLIRWVTAKTINSCAMWRLLSAINIVQQESYTSRLQMLEPRLRQIANEAERGQPQPIDGMFSFPDRLKRQIIAQIRGMMESIAKDDPNAIGYIGGLIERYWLRWAGGATPDAFADDP